ncbi:hypothetical protein JIN85_07960 [Luteolibacter pohnpeiensis]|uniref:Uncharacterized protein n=1 Tax=Luteolibacter pohnpeiensis TaxID=454153 RepID=A0A934S6U7_9BACT|nr:hypothetical protein [Luteolibacter pohnpeiensis]MBK1882345.1 hypothetical protein [Luteolibacter pohnpeiensis]
MKHLLIGVLLIPTACLADVAPASSHAESSMDITSTIGELVVDTEINLNGDTNASTLDTQTESTSNENGTLTTTYTSGIQNAHTVYAPSIDFLQIIGGQLLNIKADATGSWTPDASSEVTNVATGTSEISTEFSITGSSMPVSLSGEIKSPAQGMVSLQKAEDGEWSSIFTYSTRGTTPDPFLGYSFTDTLEPGTYRLISATDYADPIGIDSTIRQSTYDLQIGEDTTTEYIPPQGEYTHPLIGTFYTNSPSLQMVSPSVISQTSLGNGMTELQVTTSLKNVSVNPWNGITVRIPETFEGGPAVVIVDGGSSTSDSVLSYGQIMTDETSAPEEAGDHITVQVADADVDQFIASILDGSRFTTHGREQWVFLYPVDLLTEQRLHEILAMWEGPDSTPLTFGGPSDLKPGTILLVNRDVYPFPLLADTIKDSGLISTNITGDYKQGLDLFLPFLVGKPMPYGEAGVIYGRGRLITDPNRWPMSLLEMVKHGTVQDHVDTSHPSGFAVNAGLDGSPIPTAKPIHFNKTVIPGGIEISGSIFIRPAEFDIEFRIDDGEVSRFTVTTDLTVDASMIVEMDAAANNEGAALVDQEKQLFSLPLLTIVLPSGLTFSPVLSLDVGALVNVPTSLTVPIQSTISLTGTAGVVDGEPFYEQSFEVEPPSISAPAIFNQLGANVSAWAKAELYCRLGVDSIGVGPTFGVKIGGELEIKPGGSPWWTLDGKLEYLAGVELDLLDLVNLLDEETTIDTKSLFHLDSTDELSRSVARTTQSVTLPDNPGIRPISGANTRWARILEVPNTGGGLLNHFIFPLANSTDFLVGAATEVSRYTAEGALLWTKSHQAAAIAGALPHPDGGFVTVTAGEIDLARYDGDGKRLWHNQKRKPGDSGVPSLGCRPGAVEGTLEYFVTAWHADGSNPNDFFLLKYDDSGNLLWTKIYQQAETGGIGEPKDLLVTPEGDVIIVGYTDADVDGPTLACPFVMKVDGDDGSLIWAKMILWSRGGSFTHVAQDEEGTLYLGGVWGNNILDKIPTITIGKMTSDGEWLGNIMLGSATSEKLVELSMMGGINDNPIPNNGETILDRIDAMTWGEGHLWIAGHIGSGANLPSLSNGQYGFTARLSDKMEVTRYAMFGGTNVDALAAIYPTTDGVLVAGFSSSVLPWGNEARNSMGRLIMKLPNEGLLRFHDLSGMKQPNADDSSADRGSYLIYPSVYAASSIGAFVNPRIHDLGFIESTLELEETYFPFEELSAVVPLAHYQIEAVPEEMVTDYDSYTKWYQINTEEDFDGDGLDTASEFYYGTDPLHSSSISFEMRAHPDSGEMTIGFPRSALAEAAGWTSPLEASEDLSSWSSDLPEGVGLEQKSVDGSPWLFLTPFVAPGKSQYFYRLGQPEAP